VVVAFVVGVVVTRFSTAGEAMTEAAVARKRMEKMFFMMANSKTGVEMLGDGTWDDTTTGLGMYDLYTSTK
jgi:hypothetical protein